MTLIYFYFESGYFVTDLEILKMKLKYKKSVEKKRI